MTNRTQDDARRAASKSDLEQVREVVDSWVNALCARDVDRLLGHYAPDALWFDIAPPLSHRMAAFRDGLKQWFASFDGPLEYTVSDLNVSAAEKVAFSTSLNRLRGKRTNAEQTDVWMRATLCFGKREGKWLIVHEHISVPLYMDGSGKAAVDLQP